MTTHWLDANDISIRAVLEGDGPMTLVLLHEMGGSLESWDWMVPHLPAGVRVLRPDMRGSGMSQKITGAVTLNDLVADLKAVIDRLAPDGPLVLAGCAVAAAVAVHFARRHHDRIAGLVLMAPALGVAPDRRAFSLDRADAVERDGMRPMTLAGHDRSYPEQFRTDPARVAMIRAIKMANDPHSFAAIQRMLVGLDMTDDLRALTVPSLFLGGASDTTRPPDMVRAAAALAPRAVFETIESGHGMGYLTPELTAARITAFLRNEVSSS